VWHVVVWILWRARNEKIFLAKDVDVEVLFDKNQITSWK
jgi:sRNA-binding carbon storage regulator CsrA